MKKKMGVVGHVVASLEEKLKEHIEEANMQVPDANIIETVKKKKMKMMKMMKMMMGGGPGGPGPGMMKKKKKKKKKMMGGPGPGMKKMKKQKKKMMGGPGPGMKPSSTKWRLVEYTASAGGGCMCFRADKAPDPNNATVAHITTYNSATECGNAANLCRDNCSQQIQVINALKENIKTRESNGENSTALLDAKELFRILQKRHSLVCKKHKPAMQPSSSSSSSSGSQSANPSASLASSATGSLRAIPRAAELSAEITGKNPQKKNEILTKSLSWWWPSPPEVINKMFKLANLKAGEVVYDLGCGDGRIPIQAAAKWDCTGVGVDFDENLCKQAVKRATRFGVSDKVEIRHGDALQVNDIGKADVVSLYILDRGMKLMKPILEAQLKKGARVVSHNYKFKGWKPTKRMSALDKEGHKHWIYLYTM
jgi:protein-L-isoaspartate O-methyltransferase